VSLRRLELVPQFKDFDRRHEGFVSRDQFLRVLRNEAILPTSTAAIDALVKKFAGTADRTARVDYRTFISLVDPRPGLWLAKSLAFVGLGRVLALPVFVVFYSTTGSEGH
jgi:hypothetical protein